MSSRTLTDRKFDPAWAPGVGEPLRLMLTDISHLPSVNEPAYRSRASGQTITAYHAVVHARSLAASCQSCSCGLGDEGPGLFLRSAKPRPMRIGRSLLRARRSATLRQRQRHTQPLNPLQNPGEQLTRHRHLGQLEDRVP